MTSESSGLFGPDDWDRIRLVVFDLDGTLYRQRPLRIAMAAELVAHSLRNRSFADMRTLSIYRREREALGERASDDFMTELVLDVARQTGRTRDAVDRLVAEWIEQRPLRHLRRSRVAGASEVFDGLRCRGVAIGVWSDYPVAAKLAALDLAADHMRSACDGDILCLKPGPKGLLAIMDAVGVGACETLMIGDRHDRDAAAAARAGVPAILRTAAAVPGHHCFRDFTDPLFAPVRGR